MSEACFELGNYREMLLVKNNELVIFLSGGAQVPAAAEVCPESGNKGALTLRSQVLYHQDGQLPGGQVQLLELTAAPLVVGMLPSLLSLEKTSANHI